MFEGECLALLPRRILRRRRIFRRQQITEGAYPNVVEIIVHTVEKKADIEYVSPEEESLFETVFIESALFEAPESADFKEIGLMRIRYEYGYCEYDEDKRELTCSP